MSDNAACRRFEVHDFVPLFTWMIKNVKQTVVNPLYAENPHPRCTILFRFGMFLFRSVKRSGHPYFKGVRCIVLFRFIDDVATKRELARFCSALIRPIVYFTSKQRSSSATLCRKVPILFRARAETPFNRGASDASRCIVLFRFQTCSSREPPHFRCFFTIMFLFRSVFCLNGLKKEGKCTILFRFHAYLPYTIESLYIAFILSLNFIFPFR